MKHLPTADRVRLWNSFFHLARRDAKALFELREGCEAVEPPQSLGGMLSAEQTAVLGTLALCTLAVEARANHLIQKLVDQRRLSPEEGEAAEHLSTDQKWSLLPKLAGRRRRIRRDRRPHQAICEICSLRNDVVHVRFGKLSTKLPPPDKMLSLYAGFVDAMVDMNNILGDSRGYPRRVQQMARFKCKVPG